MFSQVPTKLTLTAIFQGLLCRPFTSRFRNYWTWVHFKRGPHEYFIHLDSHTLDEIKIKRDLDAFYECLGYEKVFGPYKVKHYLSRKRSIDTHVIVGATSSPERKKIFGEDSVIPA